MAKHLDNNRLGNVDLVVRLRCAEEHHIDGCLVLRSQLSERIEGVQRVCLVDAWKRLGELGKELGRDVGVAA